MFRGPCIITIICKLEIQNFNQKLEVFPTQGDIDQEHENISWICNSLPHHLKAGINDHSHYLTYLFISS